MSVAPLDPAPVATAVVSAGVLFTDGAGRVLMVRTGYKDYWDIPGGYVKLGESPRAACRREVWEELGLQIDVGVLLSVDWAPHPQEGDKMLFIFDGGALNTEAVSRIEFRDREIVEYAFVEPDRIEKLTIPRLTRRLRSSIGALRHNGMSYLENGTPPASDS